MRDTKRPRTKPVASTSNKRSPSPPTATSSRHSSPARKNSHQYHHNHHNHRPRIGGGQSSPQQLRLPRIPAGLFPGKPLVIPAHPYARPRHNKARYYIFEHKDNTLPDSEQSSSSPSSYPPQPFSFFADFRRSRKPPPRPVPPMLNYVQILTTPTADTPGTCLMVHHDNRRYLFGNIAEGTQRMFVQQKVSLARTEEIFLTGPINWHTAGGLLGMILTVAEVVQSARTASIGDARQKAARLKKEQTEKKNDDAALARAEQAVADAVAAKPKSFNIHGGENLAHLLATARRFVFRKGLPIRPHEVREDTSRADEGHDMASLREADWADENMMVWYVPVFADGRGPERATSAAGASSRKRAFEDVDESKTEEEEEADKDALLGRQLVQSVVNHMFDSDWKLDALTESTLYAAKLPAKLFVKDAKGHLAPYEGPMPGDGPDVPDVQVFLRQPWPGSLIHALPHTHAVRQSMCYIVRNHPRRGKVNAAEVARLGVAKRDIRLLVEGKSVTAADGTTVTPDMVVGATVEGAAFAVVDLPDAAYVDAFLAKPEWRNEGLMAAINTIFWLLGPGLAADARLQAFMTQHDTIRHTISSTDTCANKLALSSAAAVQMKHNRIDAARFPIQKYNNIAPLALTTTPAIQTKKGAPSKPGCEAAQAGWSIRLAPQVIVEEQKVFPPLNVTASCHLDASVVELANKARAQIAEPAFQQAVAAGNRGLPRADVEVIPLGTGSAMPSKYRNVSATLVRVPGVGSYLFDAGENTLGSMRRLLGDAQLDAVLGELRAVWISHLHADHHLGTVSVIRAWRDATAGMTSPVTGAAPRLLVASHINMHHWLREYAEIEDFGLERLHQVDLDCHDYPRKLTCPPVVFSNKSGGTEAAEFGLDRIDACRVEHCHGALAVVFTWTPETPGAAPFKVAYSGDCRPSADFVAIGRGATLLLHESTFDDELASEAAAKNHSTMGEAIDVGRRMGARRLLLTHFSQRYPKIPVFNTADDAADDDAKADAMQILIAFDQMRVKLCDFKEAATYLPAFQKLYELEE